MSVVGATVDAFKEHPLIWGGILVGAVAVVWLASRGGSSATPQSFNFSYGPSDAQVAAGTALQIAQVQANAYASTAASHDALAGTVAQDYFGYLATSSANGLTATQDTLAAATTINGQNVGGSTYVAGLNLQGLKDTNATQASIAANNNSTQLAALVNTNNLKWATTQNDNNLSWVTTQANIQGQLAAIDKNNATAITINTNNNNTAWATVQNNNATALAEQAASISGSLTAQQVQGSQQLAVIGAEQPYVMAQIASNERLTANAQAIGLNEAEINGMVTSQVSSNQALAYMNQPKASSGGIGSWLSGAAGVLGLASLL